MNDVFNLALIAYQPLAFAPAVAQPTEQPLLVFTRAYRAVRESISFARIRLLPLGKNT